MEIELRHLRLVQAVAEAGSISRAATVLGATQPSVTRQLSRLETAFGGTLFERTARGVVPTALGSSVLARARAVLPVVDSLLGTQVQGPPGPELGSVTVGSAIGQSLVALLRSLGARLPSTPVSTEGELRVTALRSLVAAGRVDAVIVHENPGFELELPSHVERHVLCTEPVLVMLAADHRLARHQELELTDAATESWVLEPMDGDRGYEYVAQVFARAGCRLQVAHQLSGAVATEMVRYGGHLSLVYAMARPPDLVTVPLVGAPLRYRQVLLVDRRSPFAPFADEVVAATRAELGRMAHAHPVLGPYLERNGPPAWTSPGTG